MLDLRTAAGPAPIPTFDAAYAEYLAKRAYSDALAGDTNHDDAATDAYCQAMDFLIEQVPAPTVAALRVKIGLAHERTKDLELFDGYWTAIIADLDRLAAMEAREAANA